MAIKDAFIKELKQEATSTRRILERVPTDKPDWKPHTKSMELGYLATHVAEIPGWIASIIDHDELDFAKIDYKPVIAKSSEELLKIHDDNVSKAMKALENAPDEKFSENWTLRMGDKVFFTRPKTEVIRSFSLSHWIHHRAQIGVYLRLLDIPLPGVYGPTADDNIM